MIKSYGFNPVNLNQMFKTCQIIYVLAAVTTKNKNLIDKKLLNKMKSNSLFILMSRAAVVNFKDLIKRVKKGDIFVATDVFPEEPVRKNDPIRKVKNILFSAHRAGALEKAFFDMGNIVLKDMALMSKNLQPKFCKKAQSKTVGLLASKPVAIN
jgi:phosphoglycerate dehydrogenase-like enzyme